MPSSSEGASADPASARNRLPAGDSSLGMGVVGAARFRRPEPVPMKTNLYQPCRRVTSRRLARRPTLA